MLKYYKLKRFYIVPTQRDLHLYEHRESDIPRDVLATLVLEPTEELIRNWGSTFQYEHTRSGTRGKEFIREDGEITPTSIGSFVASHNLLLVAPYPGLIGYNEISWARPDLRERRDDELAAAQEERLPSLTSSTGVNWPFTDAGVFAIDSSGYGEVSGVRLMGHVDYIRQPSVRSRKRTAGLLSAALNGIPVTTRDLALPQDSFYTLPSGSLRSQ